MLGILNFFSYRADHLQGHHKLQGNLDRQIWCWRDGALYRYRKRAAALSVSFFSSVSSVYSWCQIINHDCQQHAAGLLLPIGPMSEILVFSKYFTASSGVSNARHSWAAAAAISITLFPHSPRLAMH